MADVCNKVNLLTAKVFDLIFRLVRFDAMNVDYFQILLIAVTFFGVKGLFV